MNAEGLTSSMAIHDQRPGNEMFSVFGPGANSPKRDSPSNKKILSPDGVNRPKGALITKVAGNASIGTKNAHFLAATQ